MRRLVPSVILVALVTLLLTIVHFKLPDRQMLLLDRFWSGSWFLQVIALNIYGVWVLGKILDIKSSAKWRIRIWLIFSIWFYIQFILGYTVSDKFLMTGEFHLPISAIILAGPLYRFEGLFMPILYLSTIILVGPAWCSYLCYLGAWDGFNAAKKSRAGEIVITKLRIRYLIMLLIIILPLLLHFWKIAPMIAGLIAVGYGIGGIVMMFTSSRRSGVMQHCLLFCPIGILSDFFGKISPFRVTILKGCKDCNICSNVCRYNALTAKDIQSRKPGFTCTLCGDCIDACHFQQIEYRVFNSSGNHVRTLFITLIVSLHVIFLGLARV